MLKFVRHSLDSLPLQWVIIGKHHFWCVCVCVCVCVLLGVVFTESVSAHFSRLPLNVPGMLKCYLINISF